MESVITGRLACTVNWCTALSKCRRCWRDAERQAERVSRLGSQPRQAAVHRYGEGELRHVIRLRGALIEAHAASPVLSLGIKPHFALCHLYTTHRLRRHRTLTLAPALADATVAAAAAAAAAIAAAASARDGGGARTAPMRRRSRCPRGRRRRRPRPSRRRRRRRPRRRCSSTRPSLRIRQSPRR